MDKKEKKKYLQDIGYTSIEDLKFAKNIIKELDEKLSKMTEEERNQYFKKMGLIFEEKSTESKHHELIRLKAYLAALHVLSEQQKQKTGMEEMIELLNLQGCLIPAPPEEHIEISDAHLAILKAQINEDIRQIDVALNESVSELEKRTVAITNPIKKIEYPKIDILFILHFYYNEIYIE